MFLQRPKRKIVRLETRTKQYAMLVLPKFYLFVPKLLLSDFSHRRRPRRPASSASSSSFSSYPYRDIDVISTSVDHTPPFGGLQALRLPFHDHSSGCSTMHTYGQEEGCIAMMNEGPITHLDCVVERRLLELI